MKQIIISPSYIVPAKYLELDENCEVVCDKCHGEGTVVMVYGQFQNTKMSCLDCQGSGKRLKCTKCGSLCNHGKLHHKNRPDFDSLCYNCIREKLEIEAQNENRS